MTGNARRVASLAACVIAIAAVGTARRADAQEPGSRQAIEQAAAVNTELALAYLKEGNLAAARDKIEKALKQNSRTAETQMAAGFVYDRLGDKRKASSHYEEAARLGKDDPNVINNAAVYFCRNGDYKKGEALLLQAATSPLNKSPAVAYTNAGRCAQSAGRTKEAEQHFREALAIDPKQPDALLQFAELAQAQGNSLQARAFLERYYAVSPASPATLWLGRKIELSLGDTAQAAKYAQRLRDDFPTSKEAGLLLDEEQARQ